MVYSCLSVTVLKSRHVLGQILRSTNAKFAVCLSYKQGQVSNNGTREYFYYIDHQGQLFLDDARMKNFTSCFKEKDFLRFFFKRLKKDDNMKYRGFPYVSPCGVEMNYIRCDDVPIVFTKVMELEGKTMLSYNNGEEKLVVPFEPENVCMQPDTGRVYHPAPSKAGSIGLIKSLITMEWSANKLFGYSSGTQEDVDPPTHFTWQGNCYTLNNHLHKQIRLLSHADETDL